MWKCVVCQHFHRSSSLKQLLISVKFHMQPSGKGKTKVYIHVFGTGHMTKVAVIPLYGKNLKKKVYSRSMGWITLKLTYHLGL